MANYRTSRALPIILVIVVIIIAIASLVSLARVVFFSGSSTSTTKVDISREALLSTDINRRVEMTVRGPIVADEAFHSYQIDISPTSRSMRTYNGYLGTVVGQTDLTNSTAAYEQFIFALDKADLTKGTELIGDKNDVRGICATGRVFEFAIINGTDTVKKLWTSTCKGSTGSLDASVQQLQGLFTVQIPGSAVLINNVNL